MDDTPDTGALPPSLIFLKWLVIVLMVTMIGGVITIVGLLVTRMPDGSSVGVPEAVVLPEGERAAAVTVAVGMLLVVTESQRLLVFDRMGTLIREVDLAE
ncbi:DUF6476 family protein [Tabrizicola sp. TH137]|uniref:DUF6476 family protein n=1 Tax=Tabrizicola sp. TH137 TaxID=2067452 RepID=UPI00130440B7|nr:DUF6476 family protein [Tabrizicola sp. TH137]